MLSPAEGTKPSILFHRQYKVQVTPTPLTTAVWDIFEVTEMLHQVPELHHGLQSFN